MFLLNKQYIELNEELYTNIDEITALNNLLDKQNKALNELVITKEKLFSVIVHDLKSPFSSLIGLSSMLKENASEFSVNKIKNYSRNIHDAATSGHRFLENLLEWSKLQKGVFRLKPELFAPSVIIHDVLDLCFPAAHLKNITLIKNIECDESLYTDIEMTKTVLRNLLTNAIKFSEEGSSIIIE